jgi:23S rRNA (cytosine1962-C5)-methyltransferase
VLKLYSAIWFERLDEIRAIVQEELKPERIILRLSRNIQEAAGKRNLKDGLVIDGAELEGAVQFLENGIKFEADILKGQKTGFFLDQRENRREIGLMAKGKTVLNAFSFSGGFSVYAAAGGARSVTDLDISAHALESSRRNFALNDSKSLRECKHEIIQADAFEWLKTAKRSEYDLIVLDPPALAKRQNERERALAAYSQLALSATKLARKKGRLLCCSCSAHVRSEEFIGTVESAMKRSGRKFEVTKITREPPDHHPSFPEAEYLKAIYLALD